MSETQKSLSEHQELTQEAQQHLANLEALVRFRELHPEIFEAIAPKVKAVLTEGENPVIPVFSEEEIKEQILTKPRKNKYGLVMKTLEQELENIKLGFLEIEIYQGARYEHSIYGKEDPVKFFNRVYWKYKEVNCIFQDDLLAIDQKFYTALENLLNRKNNNYEFKFSQLLPTSSSRLSFVRNKILELEKHDGLSYFGTRIKAQTI